jgi:hypothetical protein
MIASGTSKQLSSNLFNTMKDQVKGKYGAGSFIRQGFAADDYVVVADAAKN